MAEANPTGIDQVTVELVDNLARFAIKHTAEGGRFAALAGLVQVSAMTRPLVDDGDEAVVIAVSPDGFPVLGSLDGPGSVRQSFRAGVSASEGVERAIRAQTFLQAIQMVREWMGQVGTNIVELDTDLDDEDYYFGEYQFDLTDSTGRNRQFFSS